MDKQISRRPGIGFRSLLVSVVKSWVMLSKLLSFLLSQSLDPVILLTLDLSLILTTEPSPEGHVDQRRHGDQCHRNSMAFDKTRAFVGFVQLILC